MEVELKLMESGYTTRRKDKPTNKSKFINRRNITGGKILINRLDNNDVVDENCDIPTKENIYELLDQMPAKVSSHLESLIIIFNILYNICFKCLILDRKSGNFSWISKRAIRNLMETKAKVQKPIQGDHMEDDLINLITDMTEFYHKLFFFFQGLLSGLSVMHILLIYLNKNETDSLKSYSVISLRLNQLFHIVSLLSIYGSIYRTIHAKKLCNILKYRFFCKLF